MDREASSRRPFILRYSAPISWGSWLLSAYLVVALVWDRAPHRTASEWFDLLSLWVTVTLMPLAVILQDHQAKRRGHRLPLRWFGYALIGMFFFAYGLAGAEWTADMPGSNVKDLGDRVGAVLVYGMVPAVGAVMVWTHYDGLRRREVRDQADESPEA